MERLGSDPPGPYEATVGYSRVVRSGPHVWVAGCTSVDEDGVVQGVTAGEQMAIALQVVVASLERVGASARDVVRTRMFTTDIARAGEIGRAHGAVFGDVRPVTAMYEVSGFIDPRMLVEVEAEAFVEA
ncbi:MAG: RidA family protein [Conexibacter sp.]|nr:RidA family protein [Conexibacter sp.]